MTDQTDLPQTPESKAKHRKGEHRILAFIVAFLCAYATRDLVAENNAGTAVLGTIACMGLLWYALGGLIQQRP